MDYRLEHKWIMNWNMEWQQGFASDKGIANDINTVTTYVGVSSGPVSIFKH